jgi:hypothetical protein
LWFEETIPFREIVLPETASLRHLQFSVVLPISGVSVSCSVIAHLESLARVIRNVFYLMGRRE